MKSYAYAVLVTALSAVAQGQATQQQCAALRCPAAVTQANPSGTTPPLANTNTNSANYFGCAATSDQFYTALGNARTSGINGISTDAAAATDAACLASCQATLGCAGYFFNPAAVTTPAVAANTCYIFSQQGAQIVLNAIQNTPYDAAGGNDVQFYCPPVSSSSIAPSSSAPIVGASSSVAAIASSSVPAVASASASIGASAVSSAPAAASSGAVSSSGPSCPASNAQIFSAATAGGVSAFNIVCGSGTVGKRALPAPIARRQVAAPLNAFGICITTCANVATCQSVLFNPLNGACVLFNCIVPVPAGLSGATRVTTAGGSPFIGQACPADIPTTIPPSSLPANSTAPVYNININIDINVLAGEYKGVPYTQICKGKCDACTVCTKKAVDSTCSVCQQKGKDSPLKPSTSYCPPGVPGKAGFPGTCTECEAEKATAVATSKPKSTGYGSDSSSSGSGSSYSSSSGNDTGASTGKYTGPYSNDAAGLQAMYALVGGAALLALTLA